MARYIATTLLGVAAFNGVYFVGRMIAAGMGYGAHVSLGDTLAITLPTILAVVAAIAIWARD